MKDQYESGKDEQCSQARIKRNCILSLLGALPVVELENNVDASSFSVTPHNMQIVDGCKYEVSGDCWRLPRPDEQSIYPNPNGLVSINSSRSCDDASNNERWFSQVTPGFLYGAFHAPSRVKVKIVPLWDLIESIVSLRTIDEIGFSNCYVDVAHYCSSSIVQKVGEKWTPIASSQEIINRYTTTNTDFKGRPKTISNHFYVPPVCESPIVESGAILAFYVTMDVIFNIILDDVSIESRMIVKANLMSVDISFI